jgi:hypothetical protein
VSGGISDPANYRRMSEPFANVEEAGAAYEAFMKELVELRKRHRIKDVFVVSEIAVITADGEAAATMVAHLGDAMHELALAAYGFGEASERQKRIIEQAQANARKRTK